MNQSTRWLFYFVLGFLCLTAESAWAQGNAAVVRPNPAIVTVGKGQVQVVDVVLENAVEVYGIEVRAQFDPTVVEVFDADPVSSGIQMIPGTFVKPDFLVRNTVDNQKGTLQYVITQVNPTPPANGDGIVVSIQFRGKTVGKQSPFIINLAEIADRQGRKLPVRVQNGTLSIVEPKPPKPNSTPPETPAAALPQTDKPNPPSEPNPEEATFETADTTPGASSSNLLWDGLLISVACGGFAGTFALLAVTVFFLFRKPRHSRQPPGVNMAIWR